MPLAVVVMTVVPAAVVVGDDGGGGNDGSWPNIYDDDFNTPLPLRQMGKSLL